MHIKVRQISMDLVLREVRLLPSPLAMPKWRAALVHCRLLLAEGLFKCRPSRQVLIRLCAKAPSSAADCSVPGQRGGTLVGYTLGWHEARRTREMRAEQICGLPPKTSKSGGYET